MKSKPPKTTRNKYDENFKIADKNLTSFADHLDQEYGKRGTKKEKLMNGSLKLSRLVYLFRK